MKRDTPATLEEMKNYIFNEFRYYDEKDRNLILKGFTQFQNVTGFNPTLYPGLGYYFISKGHYDFSDIENNQEFGVKISQTARRYLDRTDIDVGYSGLTDAAKTDFLKNQKQWKTKILIIAKMLRKAWPLPNLNYVTSGHDTSIREPELLASKNLVFALMAEKHPREVMSTPTAF